MAVSTTITTANAISQYWHKKALNKLEAEAVFYKLGWKDVVAPGNGKTVNWVRFPLATEDTTEAVEGVPVVPESLTAANLSTTLRQYVAAVSFSDVLQEETFVEGGMEEAAAEFIAQKLKYTVDALNRAEINSTCTTSGSNLYTVATEGTDTVASIAAGDQIAASDLRRMRAILANRNVPKYDGDRYAMVIHTTVEYDIRSATAAGEWMEILKRTESGIKDLSKDSIVGDIFGLSIYSSSLVTSAADGAAGATVYYNVVMGKEALGISELRGKRMEIIRKKGGDSGNTYDLANQIGGACAYNTVYAAKNLSESAANARILRLASSTDL